jgi:dTMP kinase
MFIVIEGSDGSGKTTQAHLLANHMRRSGYEIYMADFPCYQSPTGTVVSEYPNGSWGDPTTIDPYIASLPFVLDRFAHAPTINQQLLSKKIVICNRYTGSNLAHQGSKIIDEKQRAQFFDHIFALEYAHGRIPCPDISFVLLVDPTISQRLLTHRGAPLDGHERNPDFLRHSYDAYRELTTLFPNRFVAISCMDESTDTPVILSEDLIHRLICQHIVSRFPEIQLVE